jgi:hypothetical protein
MQYKAKINLSVTKEGGEIVDFEAGKIYSAEEVAGADMENFDEVSDTAGEEAPAEAGAENLEDGEKTEEAKEEEAGQENGGAGDSTEKEEGAEEIKEEAPAEAGAENLEG